MSPSGAESTTSISLWDSDLGTEVTLPQGRPWPGSKQPGQPGGPSKMPLRPPGRLGCPMWSRASKCDALLRPGLVGPAAAKPSADWTPALLASHSPHPPRIGKKNLPP